MSKLSLRNIDTQCPDRVVLDGATPSGQRFFRIKRPAPTANAIAPIPKNVEGSGTLTNVFFGNSTEFSRDAWEISDTVGSPTLLFSTTSAMQSWNENSAAETKNKNLAANINNPQHKTQIPISRCNRQYMQMAIQIVQKNRKMGDFTLFTTKSHQIISDYRNKGVPESSTSVRKVKH